LMESQDTKKIDVWYAKWGAEFGIDRKKVEGHFHTMRTLADAAKSFW